MSLESFILSGAVCWMILAFMTVETLALAAFNAKRGRGWSLRYILLTIIPGACLVLALHAALTGPDWVAVAGWLALSFPFHIADLWLRPPPPREGQ